MAKGGRTWGESTIRHSSRYPDHSPAQRRRIPIPVLQKILTRFASQKLLVSVQGPSGGYRLSRPPEEIALAEVIPAIEGSFRLTSCSRFRKP